ASVDAHTVFCLDARSGERLWRCSAGGRVDSPPAVHEGLVLFGSADGYVYCLRAEDGVLVWRFRAAPAERRIVAMGQMESAWPVHGSVLVKDGVVYTAAGRSSFVDGGIWLYALEPRTGEILHETRIEGPYPDPATDVGRPFDMDGTRSDVLVSDGSFIYMLQSVFDEELVQQDAPRLTDLGNRRMGRHLMATAGLLDDSWWNRTYWMYAECWPGFYIAQQSPKAGQILVFDDETTYALKCYTLRNRHSPMFFPGKTGYLLFADDNDNEPVLVNASGSLEAVAWLPPIHPAVERTLNEPAVDVDKGVGFTRASPSKWTAWIPVRARAMVLAENALFLAGPPDVLDPADPLAAFEGRKGALLWAVEPATGDRQMEIVLESPPVFDGMIAAQGRLVVALENGRVVSMGREGPQEG
ncbi:MAG TPA: hypothetical protein ENN80_06705, partial [Candidatus Hydrogenedentes bacterium]|nr:hypothetical protein [Candidatus Hydrogenedentota bacterium]